MSKSGDVQLVETLTSVTDAKPLAAADYQVPLPDELVHLTRDEQITFEKHLVRKIDLRLMPIIIVM